MVKFARVASGRRIDVVAGALRNAVLKGTIAPGDHLPSEREMG